MFKKYTVNDLVELDMIEKPMDGNHGGKHPKGNDFVKSGVPFIMVSDVKDGMINYKNCKYITKEQRNHLDKGFSKPGDILLSHKATIGITAEVDNTYPEIVLTPQLTYYRIKKGINRNYLKYYFDSPFFQKLLNSRASAGSTRAYIGITKQLDLPILLPEYSIQCKISKVLKALDDKIKLNNQINHNLSYVT